MITLLSATIAAALVSAIWQGALLALCAALLLKLLPGISASTRSAIWMTVFALAVALHFVPSAQAASGSVPEVHAAPVWSLALAVVWVACSLFRAAQLALSVHRVREVNRRAVPLAVEFETPKIRRHYQVCTSPDVDRPSVLGFFSPRVLLPAGLAEKLTAAELHQVLLHETEHLRRSDDWTNLLQKLALVLFPLNPALLYIERRLCEERELACDDRVLSAAGPTPGIRKAYATCLTHLAEHTILRRGLSLALGAWHRKPELTRRVHRILAPAQQLMPTPVARFAAASLVLTLGVAGGVLARSPQLISFAPVPAATVEQAATMVPATFHTSTAAAPVLTSVHSATRVAPGAFVETRARVRHAHHRLVTPQYVETTLRSPEPQQRVTFTLTAEAVSPEPQDLQPAVQTAQPKQVQSIYVPAVFRVPVAYAAVRTPDGWIIFQL